MVTDGPTSLYRYFDRHGALIYVGITRRGIARNVEHNNSKEWWHYVARQEVEHFDTRAAALRAETDAIRTHQPPFNAQHNPDHAALKEQYKTFRAQLVASANPAARHKSIHLNQIAPDLLVTPSVEALKLTGGIYRKNACPIIVSTPQRTRAGHALSEMRGGFLAVRIAGKFLPDEITSARALLAWDVGKTSSFWIRRVLLNEKGDGDGE